MSENFLIFAIITFSFLCFFGNIKPFNFTPSEELINLLLNFFCPNKVQSTNETSINTPTSEVPPVEQFIAINNVATNAENELSGFMKDSALGDAFSTNGINNY